MRPACDVCGGMRPRPKFMPEPFSELDGKEIRFAHDECIGKLKNKTVDGDRTGTGQLAESNLPGEVMPHMEVLTLRYE